MKDAKIFMSKGQMLFVFKSNGGEEDEDGNKGAHMVALWYDTPKEVHVVDMMSGQEFLEAVRHKAITTYDGCVHDVLLDGYTTNIGLYSDNNFLMGGFPLCEIMWLEFCAEYDVQVNWCPK